MPTFETTDIYDAAFLRSKRVPYKYAKERRRGRTTVTFQFDETPEVVSMLRDKAEGAATINLADYLDALETVKDVVFDHEKYPLTNP